MTYRTNEAFECYRTYLALKRHFTTDQYSFFKYNGKVNVSIHSFEQRNDKWHFAKLSKNSQWKELLLANVTYDPNIWIGNLFEPMAEQRLQSVAKRRSSLLYYYAEELNRLPKDFNRILTPIDGQHPILLESFIAEEVSLETMAILEHLIGFSRKWDKHIIDPVVWPSKRRLITKYQPFLNFDSSKFRKKTLDIFADIG